MKKIFKITAALLAALMLALALAACGAEINEASAEEDEEAVRALIAECESACRAKDIERVLKTLDPKVEKTVRKIAGLAAKVTGNEELTFEGLRRGYRRRGRGAFLRGEGSDLERREGRGENGGFDRKRQPELF